MGTVRVLGRLIGVLALAAVVVAGLPTDTSRERPAWRENVDVFAASSPWRQSIPADARPHPRSQEMMADLTGACAPGGPCAFPRLAGAPEDGLLGSPFGSPVYVAREADPRFDVPCRRYSCGVASKGGEQETSLDDVPIPVGARPDDSSDGHLVVLAPDEGNAWDLWRAEFDAGAGSWSAGSGIRWDLHGDGVDEIGAPGSATGAGAPLAGTVLRPDEVRQALRDGTGVVGHKLSGGYDSPRPGCVVRPFAKKTDADDGRRWAIPEGAVLQLDPALDVDALEVPEAVRVIARTLQRYGFVVRDDSGAFTIDAETVSREEVAHRGRARLWQLLGVTKNALSPVTSERFRVLDWDPADAHGTNCP